MDSAGFVVARRRGSSIIELLVVIVIIGIFATVALPRVGGWLNEFRMEQVVQSIFAEMRSLRVEAIARERCGRTRVDIDNNVVYFEIAKPGVNEGFFCGTDDLTESDWDTARSPIHLPPTVNLSSAGAVSSGAASYISFTKHGGSGANNMGGNHNGFHFHTVSPTPVDECDYLTTSFENPSGLLLDFKVYDGTHTLSDPPGCSDW